jgi:hypothetical protein
MQRVKTSPPQFRVGDWVQFQFGPKQVVAQVIEDRGPIGVHGRRLYRVRLDQASTEPYAFEIPEQDLEPAAFQKAEVVRYLQNGGLVEILRSNVGGHAPRVWLTLSAGGEVLHTFQEERGIVGGEIAPFFAIHDDKVFTPKTSDVIEFLKTFGLSLAEAEEVLSAVGTAP